MLSVFIPILNEEAVLESSAIRVHDYLDQQAIEHEVIVVSNGSTDRSDEIGERLSKNHPWFRYFSIPEKGPGRAFKLGVREAKGEMVVTLDIDLSSDLDFVGYAHDLLRYADMIVGSKTMGNQRRSPLRVIGSQSYILFTQLLFDLTISDYSIGCKAFKRSNVLPILDQLDPWTGYMFELSVFHKLHELKLLQVGVNCDDRRVSRFSLWHEGIYRYRHLYRTWREMKREGGWMRG